MGHYPVGKIQVQCQVPADALPSRRTEDRKRARWVAAMLRTILIYGVILAAGAFGLEWLQYRFLMRAYPTQVWVVLIALAFMGLGVWVGARLFRTAPAAVPFEANSRVQE